jgi:hypothetical protein
MGWLFLLVGKTIIYDCSVCHNLVASDEANPKQLSDLGLQSVRLKA